MKRELRYFPHQKFFSSSLLNIRHGGRQATTTWRQSSIPGRGTWGGWEGGREGEGRGARRGTGREGGSKRRFGLGLETYIEARRLPRGQTAVPKPAMHACMHKRTDHQADTQADRSARTRQGGMQAGGQAGREHAQHCSPPPPTCPSNGKNNRKLTETPSVAWTRALLQGCTVHCTRANNPQGV